MITHLFLVIACLAIFFVIYPADAIPWNSEENKALDADAIAVGQIVSYRDDGAHRYYEISVIKWIKNPQLDQTITMRSITPQVFDPHVPYAIFEKKDLGLFYVKLIDGKWRSTYYSKQIFASEQNQTIYNMKKLVGNNNPDSSVSLERVCKEGHVLIQKYDGSPACVKPETKIKLLDRGWATCDYQVKFTRAYPCGIRSSSGISSSFPETMGIGVVKDGKIFDVKYSIKGGIIQEIIFSNHTNSLVITIDVTHEGDLEVTVPRDLLDAKMDYCPPRQTNAPDDRFFVMLDGEEIFDDEILTTVKARTLKIPFDINSEKIEVIGTCFV